MTAMLKLTGLLCALAASVPLHAMPYHATETWGGDLTSRTWAAVYSFEQFLWQPSGDPRRGVGSFFSAGVSDGKANPVRHSYSLELVGKGVVPGRPQDDFGIGWARTQFSDNFVPYLRRTFGLGLHCEDAVLNPHQGGR